MKSVPRGHRPSPETARSARQSGARRQPHEPQNAVQVAVRVIPRAAKTQIVGIRNGALLVQLAAPPVEGAANEALLAHLATAFNVRHSAVRLVSGQRSRDKRVAIEGATPTRLRELLTQLAEQ